MARLVVAVAASAAICSGVARAETPRAKVEGELNSSLRESIERAVGETDRPISNRFAARRRARAAGEEAIAVLRSEGYYGYDVEPDVSDGDPPAAMRYTEVRMDKLTDEMLEDIEKDTVDFRPNYNE